MKKNIMIATPAYSGKVNIPYTISLLNTALLLNDNGIKFTTLIVPSGSLLVAERNKILQSFWDSNCSHILCVDGDLGWPPQAVIAMINQNKDFIVGVYPARGNTNTFTYRPVLIDNKMVQENHLFKAEYIPAGFMLLSRECIKTMRDHFPELYYTPKDKRSNDESAFCLFDTEVWEGEFWGEDYVFCRRAREAGIDIWVDPLIQFDHDGKIGMLLETLGINNNECKKYIIDQRKI